jgi:SpoVK/Ycf46/Vps4 family AAA+-type ATPase
MLPSIEESEINLPAHIRVHAIQRLVTQFFQPFSQHVTLEARFAILIRQGYIGRNPNTSEYKKHLNNGYDRIVNRDINLTVRKDAVSTAVGFSIVGPSGCGKTTAIRRCLAKYPPAIYHPDLHVIQIPWLKLECPRNGSLTELCLNFFSAMDNRLGTQYRMKYGKARAGVDTLITEMGQLVNLHAVGVLIIDEIQNLSSKRAGGDDSMLRFFVSLTNSIGVPVVLVGTPKARTLFSSDFKMAKRTTGLGSVYWDRMPYDQNWEKLIALMWKYQWLKNKNELTDAISSTLYDLSQGVIDILIKLYVLSQWRAMITGVERLSVSLINKVYEDELKPVHQMLKALKSGDPEQINKYGDLVMPELELKFIQAFEDGRLYTAKPIAEPSADNKDKVQRILSVAEELGIQRDIAIPLIEAEISTNPDSNVMHIVHRILNQFNSTQPLSKGKPGRSKKSDG